MMTLTLSYTPPLVIYIDTPTPHIRVIWGAHYVTPSSVLPTPEYGKVLAFARDIHLIQIPTTVAVSHE